MDPENQNFEKMKKTSEDIIILQMCTINESYNFEKMKKQPGDIIILQRCTINDNHMMYGF